MALSFGTNVAAKKVANLTISFPLEDVWFGVPHHLIPTPILPDIANNVLVHIALAEM